MNFPPDLESSRANSPCFPRSMKILMSSHRFAPSVGGTEEVSRILAIEFTQAGHQVQVVTQTAETTAEPLAFPVWRRPTPATLLRLVAWSDVFFHNNISLGAAWPLLAVRRPWIIAHHTWLTRPDGRITWRERWKQRAARGATNISISRAIAEHLNAESVVIGNPYRDAVFRRDDTIPHDGELVFVGRLLPDKGLDLLLEAVALLGRQNRRPHLTIVGQGPEEGSLRQRCKTLGLDAQVRFAGTVVGPDLAALLNGRRILVVPSRWAETFGLVALEGIACGCVIVGSDRGGLPEAIGPCGLTFPSGNVPALAEILRDLLARGDDLSRWQIGAEAHLAPHRAAAVAARYLQVFAEALRR